MARNPKQDANLKPIQKGELSKEEAKKRGSKGGKKSAEVRRNKRDAKSAARYILELAAQGNLKENLATLKVEDEDKSNMVALQARLFMMAMSGNLDAYRELMKMAGYEPEENRKERESLSSDRRRDAELEIKSNALGNAPVSSVSIDINDEDGGNDVHIYLPQIEEESSCEMPPENNSSEGEEPESGKE